MKQLLGFAFFILIVSSANAADPIDAVETPESKAENAAIDKCANYFTGDWKNPTLKDPATSESCLRDCNVKKVNENFNKSVIETYFRACKGAVYKCIGLGLCRSDVDDYLACKRDGVMPSCDEIASSCRKTCTPEPGNNCVAGDIENFKQGREICATGSPARPMISPEAAQTLIDRRASETIASNNGRGSMPSEQTASQSIFYGAGGTVKTDDPDAKGGGSVETASTNSQSSASTQQGQATNSGTTSGGAMAPMASSSTSGGAVAPAALNFGGGGSSSSGSSSGGSGSGFSATGDNGTTSWTANDAVGGNGALTTDNFRGDQWGDAPASRSYNRGGSSGGGSVSGGSGSASPFASSRGANSGGGVRTASVSRGGSGSGGSLESSSFQSGFHKASGTNVKPGTKKRIAALSKTRPQKRRKKSDGSMNLRKLLASGLQKNRGLAAKGKTGFATATRAHDVGDGVHPVFTSVDNYFDTLRLDVNGDIEY